MTKDDIIIDIAERELRHLGFVVQKILKIDNVIRIEGFVSSLGFKVERMEDRLEKLLPGKIRFYMFSGRIVIYPPEVIKYII